MTRDQIRAALLHALSRIAPEMRPDDIDPGVSLRDQIDIDSMDFLNFMIAVRRDLGVDVPEADYGKLRSLNDLVDYIASNVGAGTATAQR